MKLNKLLTAAAGFLLLLQLMPAQLQAAGSAPDTITASQREDLIGSEFLRLTPEEKARSVVRISTNLARKGVEINAATWDAVEWLDEAFETGKHSLTARVDEVLEIASRAGSL